MVTTCRQTPPGLTSLSWPGYSIYIHRVASCRDYIYFYSYSISTLYLLYIYVYSISTPYLPCLQAACPGERCSIIPSVTMFSVVATVWTLASVPRVTNTAAWSQHTTPAHSQRKYSIPVDKYIWSIYTSISALLCTIVQWYNSIML